jgi:hypothetical protein
MCSFLSILLCLILLIFISISVMDPRREKRTKQGQDLASTSKKGCKAVVTRPPPPPRHPSHSSEEEDDCETFKIHSPQERTNHIVIKYSKMTKQDTINNNCGAPIYSDSQ